MGKFFPMQFWSILGCAPSPSLAPPPSKDLLSCPSFFLIDDDIDKNDDIEFCLTVCSVKLCDNLLIRHYWDQHQELCHVPNSFADCINKIYWNVVTLFLTEETVLTLRFSSICVIACQK